MDALLSLEEAFRREGEEAGFARGAALGRAEGAVTGFAQGAARSLERQFCAGAAHAVLALAEAHPEAVSVRACAAARVLASLAAEHQMHKSGNERNRDVDSDRDALRHQLRLTLALARLPPVRVRALQRDPELSF